MRGRKGTPTVLKLIKGNPAHRPLNENEPDPPGVALDPPAWYDEEHRQTWREAIDAAPLGLLRRLDAGVLNVWVCAFVAHQRALKKQQELDNGAPLPMLTRTKKGDAVESPYLRIARQQAEVMLRAGSEMGFSPSSRTRIHVEKGQKPPASKGAARFFT